MPAHATSDIQSSAVYVLHRLLFYWCPVFIFGKIYLRSDITHTYITDIIFNDLDVSFSLEEGPEQVTINVNGFSVSFLHIQKSGSHGKFATQFAVGL